MPLDKAGKFHLTSQHAMHADKMPPMAKAPAKEKETGLMAPDDEHGSVGEKLMELHGEMGGKHMHLHQGEDGSHTSHHVGHDGKVEGPHEHASADDMLEHARGVMADDGQQQQAPVQQEHEEVLSGY